jgi:uncharacterized membrane protein (DUF485 family)
MATQRELSDIQPPLAPSRSNSTVHFQAQPVYYSTGLDSTPKSVVITEIYKQDENYNLILATFMLGFFIHFAWILAFCVSRRKGPKSQNMGNISCGLFLILLLLGILVGAVIAVVVVLTRMIQKVK